ncbi:hypothetical protein Y032_0061g3194 [Ancylostoma ceylanicum]|uniref:Reverse transcriptase domain-containing protein n=1 Tax=Ancylostoma ceylanicum TaxID=53326 RepID=A0A016U2I5_9BILA|nr:hypothetical protein Y032_0061g3194 [Ancylostoma ceylanicum]
MCGSAISDIEVLLEATLACNVFRFDNNFYAQRRGLAMGIRIAPLLAIIYLDHIEKASVTNGIILYKRYIDDVFAIGSSSPELAATLANLNAQDENIGVAGVQKWGNKPRDVSNCGKEGGRRLKVMKRLESGPTM